MEENISNTREIRKKKKARGIVDYFDRWITKVRKYAQILNCLRSWEMKLWGQNQTENFKLTRRNTHLTWTIGSFHRITRAVSSYSSNHPRLIFFSSTSQKPIIRPFSSSDNDLLIMRRKYRKLMRAEIDDALEKPFSLLASVPNCECRPTWQHATTEPINTHIPYGVFSYSEWRTTRMITVLHKYFVDLHRGKICRTLRTTPNESMIEHVFEGRNFHLFQIQFKHTLQKETCSRSSAR